MIGLAVAGVRARRGRSLLAASGIAAAALMLGVALTVGLGLATGFDRSASRADLPHVIARFEPEARVDVERRVRALPNLAGAAFRFEATDVSLRFRGEDTERGVVEIVDPGRRGYAIIAGRDVRGAAPELVVERGLADAWDVGPGDRLDVGRLGAIRVVGVSVTPDNVAFPLAATARIHLTRAYLDREFGPEQTPSANVALIWAADPDRVDVLLTQARAGAYGVEELRFITRSGVRLLLHQAAGIVIALLIGFALVAAAVAGLMLGASAHSEVQRRLAAIGVQRAIGMAPAAVVRLHALEAAIVALPAAFVGLALGGVLASGPTARLLHALNELEPPAGALAALLASALVAVVALVAASAAWPAWRAARRSPARLMRGGDAPRARKGTDPILAPLQERGPSRFLRAGFFRLGMRLGTARRARWSALVLVLGTAAATMLLMLDLASLLERLRDEPATIGKRYQLTARLPASDAPAVAAIPGVRDAAPRYVVNGGASFALGSPVRLIAYPGDHTRFEAPPLASGRRARGPDEAEIGAGLADALGLAPGGRLAVQLQGGSEVTFHVVGVTRALESEGRIAYVQPDRLIETGSDPRPEIAIRLAPGADRDAIGRALRELGAEPQRVGGAVTRNGRFLGILAGLLRLVALTVGLVCLYALVQALALLARERRQAIAVLRASGAAAPTIARLLAGAAAAAVIPAALAAVVIERALLAPGVARLAADYADLPLDLSAARLAIALGGLALLAAAAAAWVGRRTVREPIVAGLRQE